MNSLTVSRIGKTETTPAGFEERLQWLRKFGKPRVSFFGNGWYSAIEMNTNTTGTSFEVKSDSGMTSPSAAVDQLIERMLTALTTLTGATP